MAASGTVAGIQLQWQSNPSEAALRETLQRFLRLAREKGAQIVVFPELTGLMLAAPLAQELGVSGERKGGILGRFFGSGTTLDDLLPTLIADHSSILIERYQALFGGLAREHRMMVVGGTILAKEGAGAATFRAGIFDEYGSLMGWQHKLHLTEAEAEVAAPGDSLETFEAALGRVGVLLGHDLLFPELARALAYRGCVGILHPTLARSAPAWQRQRLVAEARAQEDQLFLVQSFLVGQCDLFTDFPGPLVGRSGVLAPLELSPRGTALVSEVGAEGVEGVVTGTCDIAALHRLWEDAELPLRAMSRGLLYHDLLAFDYQSGATIAERTSLVESVAALPEIATPQEPPALPPPAESAIPGPLRDPSTGSYRGEPPDEAPSKAPS